MREDALRLSIGLGATWLLAFVAIAYAGHQRRAMARAIELSRTDPLTGLFNRSQLFVTLEQEVSRTRRSDRGFCVLMIDLDGLKAINDDVGHLRGDEVLRALGRVIGVSIRTVDSAYRYGGDEFVVLLPETDIVGAFVVAEKIRVGAEEVGLSMGGAEPLTSVSIGLVSHPEDGLSAEELMAAADRAMYQAKSLGQEPDQREPASAARTPGAAVHATAGGRPPRTRACPRREPPRSRAGARPRRRGGSRPSPWSSARWWSPIPSRARRARPLRPRTRRRIRRRCAARSPPPAARSTPTIRSAERWTPSSRRARPTATSRLPTTGHRRPLSPR